jgi:hypothetical protein
LALRAVICGGSIVLGEGGILEVENSSMAEIPARLIPDLTEAEEQVVFMVNFGAHSEVPVLLKFEEAESQPVILEAHIVLVLDKPVKVIVLS